mgnify:CR=1 FL=1|tara:strand:- start:6305 stop:7057 length:753 start_codon:yes stop_codon:yes gene_type:complete
MNKNALSKIISHPDKDELISKLVIGISSKDIYDWLASKYVNPNEKKFILSEKSIKSFKDNYLDIYSLIQNDLANTKIAVANNNEDDLELSIRNLPAYKNILIKTANEELDIRTIVKKLCAAIELRFSQVFDEIQADPGTINTKIDRLLIDYTEVLGNILEKYYKFTEAPVNNVIQHNVTLQVVDQHITVFHDVIKKVLSQMDLETSLYFMEVFHEEMNKLKQPEKVVPLNSEVRLAEAKLLNETINSKIN